MTDVRSTVRPFWTLWTAATATSLGDGIRLVALPLMAAQATRNPALIALVTVVTYIPAIVAGPVAGVFVDRLRKRSVIATANFARALVLAVLAVLAWHGALTIETICVAAFLYGIGEAFEDPASHAILPQLVTRGELGTANSRLQSGSILAEMLIGRAAGGLLFALSAGTPLLANFALLLAAGLLVLRLPKQETILRNSPSVDGPAMNFVSELRAGFTVVRQSRLLSRMALLVLFWASTSGAFWGVATVYALRALHSGSTGYGIMLGLSAMGSLVASRLAVPMIRRLGAARATQLALLLSVASIGGLAWTDQLWSAAVLLALNGFAVTVWNVMSITVRQATVDPRLLGRVGSTYRTVATCSVPVGAALAGLLASFVGAPPVFGVTAGVMAVAGVILLPSLLPILRGVWPKGATSAADQNQ